jgi:hypothetical protein
MRVTLSIAAILIVWLAYTVWPFIELYRLARAVETRDVTMIEQQVDFRRLRASLTSQIVATYLRLTGKTGQPGSLLEQFAVGVGASLADPMVSKLISPEALLQLLQNGKPSGVLSDNDPSIQGLSSEALGTAWRAYANSEFGIGRFLILVPVDKPIAESFRLQFCLADWTWKLCGAELPEQLQIRLAKEIIESAKR